MTYRLLFKDEALKEWRKLDGSIREQFQKKLRERLAEPRVEAARLGCRIATRSSSRALGTVWYTRYVMRRSRWWLSRSPSGNAIWSTRSQ